MRNPAARSLERPTQITVTRAPFRQDVVNLIHCAYFRRLEGKTQLFPANESDLFRDRLTHSVEVANVARDIASFINQQAYFQNSVEQDGDRLIDLDLVEFAGLAHDIGHPPFGHTGESALDEEMLTHGGFEGNAQTLRIVTRLARHDYPKDPNPDVRKYPDSLISAKGVDQRLGLNLCFRSIASLLKYDHLIHDIRDPGSKVLKGYYWSEKEIVHRTKQAVLGGYQLEAGERFHVLECSIMDVADDIAYSSYDLEDAFRAGILRASDLLYPRQEVLRAVCRDFHQDPSDANMESIRQRLLAFANLIQHFVAGTDVSNPLLPLDRLDIETERRIHADSERALLDNHLLTQLFTWWTNYLVSNVEIAFHDECPALSKVSLNKEVRNQVEALKRFVFQTVTLSAPMQAVNFKGARIVKEVLHAIVRYKDRLLPPYERSLISRLLPDGERGRDIGQDRLTYRIYCDYVAGMTDDFASSLYDQLFSGELARLVNRQIYY